MARVNDQTATNMGSHAVQVNHYTNNSATQVDANRTVTNELRSVITFPIPQFPVNCPPSMYRIYDNIDYNTHLMIEERFEYAHREDQR